MPLIVTVTATHDGDPDAVFAEALQFDELQRAMKGLATYRGFPPGGVPIAGETYVVDVTLWGMFPVTAHTIEVLRVDHAARRLESHETHRGVKNWDHTLTVASGPAPGTAIWTDRILIDAGWQTPMVARFARYVYCHRHRARSASSLKTRIERP